MTKGIIFYTDNRIGEPVRSLVRKYILESNLPIASCSLKTPIDFGHNVVVQGERSYPTMVKQIITALETSKEDYVFFCEHDCLYPKSHFDFIPPADDTFYYNDNILRWWVDGKEKSTYAIGWDRMLSLSCLCVNRQFALEHYYKRQKKIEEWGLDEFRSREPRRARIWGYEPGTKKTRNGGFSDEKCGVFHSEVVVIDIRHKGTFSAPKIQLSDFKHQPTGWREVPIDKIQGWDLCNLFNIKLN